MPVPSTKINTGKRTFFLLLNSKKESPDSSFFATAKLAKREFCEKCLGKMKATGTRWQQAQSGPIAGWDITKYTCQKCGHTHEESCSRD
jgi:hypothetical protein